MVVIVVVVVRLSWYAFPVPSLAVIRENIYVEPPLIHTDGQRNSNMASYSDVLFLNTYYYCDFCCVLAHNALFCIRQCT